MPVRPSVPQPRVLVMEPSLGHAPRPSGLLGLWHAQLAYWKLFRSWFWRATPTVDPDVVLVPFADYFLYVAAVLGSPFGAMRWIGIVMRPSFHYGQAGVLAPSPTFGRGRELLFYRLLLQRQLGALLSIDETLVHHCRSKGPARIRSKVKYLPDPVATPNPIDKRLAHSRLGLDVAKKTLLVYGAITWRKGVAELLSAMDHPAFPRNVEVVLAGALSSEVREFLATDKARSLKGTGRVSVMDGFVSNVFEAALFSAADTVWLGYVGHYGPSGVLVKAARWGIPVVACRDGIIGYEVRREGLGVLVDPGDDASVALGVAEVVQSRSCTDVDVRSKGEKYSQHTYECAGERLADVVASVTR